MNKLIVDCSSGQERIEPLTAEEQADAAAIAAEAESVTATQQVRAGNRTTIEQQATAALDTNRTFLAIASPTAAQNAAQAKALTRQMNGIIRLLLNRLDGTD